MSRDKQADHKRSRAVREQTAISANCRYNEMAHPQRAKRRSVPAQSKYGHAAPPPRELLRETARERAVHHVIAASKSADKISGRPRPSLPDVDAQLAAIRARLATAEDDA